MAGYDDGRVACTDQEIVIRHFNLWRDKHISYQAIREVKRVPNGWKWRLSGTGDFVHWTNWDPDRPRKELALVIYLDGRIRPVITPDDPDRVSTELAAHGVNVTSGQLSDVTDLKDRKPVLIALAGMGLLVAAALIDIRRRPASQIRGSKRMWTALTLLNWLLGPISYFVFGRRRG